VKYKCKCINRGVLCELKGKTREERKLSLVYEREDIRTMKKKVIEEG